MRVQFPMQKSGQWSGAKRACAGAIHAFHEPCRGGQGATRLYGHNETSSRPLIDWRGVPAVCVYPEEDGTCGAMMRKKPSAAQHVYHLKLINKEKVRCEVISKGKFAHIIFCVWLSSDHDADQNHTMQDDWNNLEKSGNHVKGKVGKEWIRAEKNFLNPWWIFAMSKWIHPRPSMSESNLTSSRSGTRICSEWGISLCGFPMRIHRQRSMTALPISLPVYDMERVTGCLCGWEARVLLDSML